MESAPAPRAPSGSDRKPGPWITRWWIQALGLPLVRVLLLFLAAGRWRWPTAWMYTGYYLLAGLVGGLMVRDPGLRAERQALGPGVPVWDRLLAPVVNLAVPATLLVAGLDAGRFAWSGSIAVGWRVAGTVALMAAPVLVTAAMRANPFFSGLVRYQVERDHRAVMAGPYRWIRHPGYLGMALFYPGTALFLGALWALIPAGVGVGAILARTHLEDRWLARTLPGYLGYAGRVRYRLLPLVW